MDDSDICRTEVEIAMYVACLMAGTSSRLSPLTKVDHKAMLKVGRQRMIDVQMKTFAFAGVERFSFVVGHGAVRLSQHLLKHYSGTAMSIVNNTHFADRNLDWSAYLALSSQPGDVLYYEGDVIASPDLIREVAGQAGDICVAMDPVGQSARIDTRVIQRPDQTCELLFSEHGSLDTSSGNSAEGELVCLVKLSNRVREDVVKRLEATSFTGPMKRYIKYLTIYFDVIRHLWSAPPAANG
jgi:NDP-sugar pyrophosphorylase family protein